MSEKLKVDEVKDVMDGISATFIGVAKELEKDAVTRGEHTSTRLSEPVSDTFGTFTKKWEYTEGCLPGEELHLDEVGEVVFEIAAPDGHKKRVYLGRTPSKYDPNEGGASIPNAGQPGPYIAAIYDPQASGEKVVAGDYRYLDEEDMSGVRLENGAEVVFPDNPARGRRLEMPGTVQSVIALVA